MAKINYLLSRDESLPVGGSPPAAVATIPVTDGLVYSGIFSGGASYASRNWSGSNGSLTGTPVTPGRYIRFPNGCFVDTGLPETLGFTCLVIGKSSPVFEPFVFMGNHAGSPATQGITLFAYDTIRVAGFIKTEAGVNGMTIASNVNSWGMYALLSPPSGVGKRLMNLTAGTESATPDTSTRQISGARNMRIGASYSASASGSVDMMCALYYNRALSQDEINQMSSWGRSYASGFGVIV